MSKDIEKKLKCQIYFIDLEMKELKRQKKIYVDELKHLENKTDKKKVKKHK